MTKVAWFDAHEWEKKYIEDEDLDIDFFDDSLNSKTVHKVNGYDKVSVFATSDIGKEVISKMDVKHIVTRSTGFDHIDLKSAKQNDILVSNIPDYGASSIAEHTFALLLSVCKRIPESVFKNLEGDFNNSDLTGFELKNKTIGVVGTGDIGKEVIRIAEGFNMNILASDPNPRDDLRREYNIEYVSKERLLKNSDIISLHAPLNSKTRHMLSKEEFDLMEETILVNTARGELLDTKAFLKALEEDKVKFAALDVLEKEENLKSKISAIDNINDFETLYEDKVLLERDDVLVTPHNAFNTFKARERLIKNSCLSLKENKNIIKKD